MTTDKQFKVFVTKYALTDGIVEKTATLCNVGNGTMIAVYSVGSYREHYHKPHWHKLLADAVVQAEKMRLAKIKSLEKKLKKIKEMKFT